MEEERRLEESRRPDPDALLKEVQREEIKRGRLKIFLGYAPGVGKTYTMLNEARVLKKRGEDVVVGIAETHGRIETEELLKGLEVIPRRRTEYQGIILGELDLDSILLRRPKVVLVDELAHTNAPGSRHPKRYQDVEELLGCGIDVYTTLNVQHFESLNDVVEKITGVRMQETLPDTFLDRADEVQVIDIPLEELFTRLKEGKVYIPPQAKQAFENFFRRGNLVALRELTLTHVAHKMDRELLNYMRAKAITGPWPAAERLMVCIAPSPYAKQLLRKGYTIAKDAHAEWYAVYVSTPTLKEMSDKDKTYITEALNLAEELGAKIATLSGTDVAKEILRFAREYNINHIVIGKPLHSMLLGFWKGSPVSRLLHTQSEFELHLITPTIEKRESEVRPTPERLMFNPKDYLLTLMMVIAVTLLNFFLERFIHPMSLVFVYLIVTIASALLFGTWPSLFSSVLCLLTFDFFFTEPKYTLIMNHPHDIINVVVFLLTSIIIGQLVKITRRQNLALQLRIKRITLIEEMSKEFLALPPIEQFVGGLVQNSKEWENVLTLFRTTVLDHISHIAMKYLSKITDAPSYVLFSGKEGRLQVWARSHTDIDLTTNEMAVAEWTYTHGEPAGSGTQTLPNINVFFLPMKSLEETIGVIGVQYDFKSLLLEQRRLLGVLSNLSALAAARWIKIWAVK
ncbi:MAG: sensor histidine kinase KdpD [Syntrophaceae bacterium]|nr:sensor histidine kinase KdpD [Syntrophaceae bacterium]